MQKMIVMFIGLVIFLLWENLRPFFPFGRKHIRRTFSNLGVALTNTIIGRFVFALPMLWILSQGTFESFGLLKLIPMSRGGTFAVSIILLDLWSYWWHRINHTIGFFWKFHRAHHTDTEMAAATAFRFHPIEIIFSSILRIILLTLLGISTDALILYETILVFSILFHHSNIAVPQRVDAIIRVLFVSPVMHKLHHSILPAEFQSNYTSIFSFWDRLFKSYSETEQPEEISLGLKIFRSESDQHYLGIMLNPFKNSGGREDPVKAE